jgi:uncharacterized protein HemX
MIRTYAIIGLLGLCLALTWSGHRQGNRAAAAEAALASATAQLQQVEKARAVHEQHLAIMARQQAAYEALATEFETMEGSDAPLSDYLRAVDQRLQ